MANLTLKTMKKQLLILTLITLANNLFAQDYSKNILTHKNPL